MGCELLKYRQQLPDCWNLEGCGGPQALLACGLPANLPCMCLHTTSCRSDCKFGTFDGETCKCKCMGEGTPGGYCPDPSTGECTAICS